MHHTPSTARCRGLFGRIFGHRFREMVPGVYVTKSRGESHRSTASTGVFCTRCGEMIRFPADDDDGDDADEGLPVVAGDDLLTT